MDQARGILAEIEALPVTAAAQLIRDRAAEAVAERFAEAARLARGADPGRWQSPATVYPSHPERGLGPSL
ncbi:hypothetical protein [Cellulomonas sp. KRMCY2]|uniref:hypothetical protein n=1 Tax=Cellulomonas sp. KRMCY2 TaxID=1304865 RepID=UPI00045EC130|nr:hypothetical protein [Cellulomonas sp. KRMCY2]